VLSEKALKYILNAKDEEKLILYPINQKFIETYISNGWNFFPLVQDFYKLYGGWFIPEALEIQAFLPNCQSFTDNLRKWMVIMNIELFPIGSNSMAFYLMSETGAIYVTDEEAHSMLKLGDTVADGFDCILWFDHEKPLGYQGEHTKFWQPHSDFPPPFIHKVFIANPPGSATKGHWEVVYPPKQDLNKT
jgi:SUKH-3 immunity protein